MDAAGIDVPSQPADELSPRRVAQLRAETPGCEHRLHLNTAGAGLPPNRVLEAVTEHLLREAHEGPVEAAAAVQPRLDETRALVAALINAQPADVAWASSCSHAWGVAFAALPPLQPGQRVLVSRQEWGGNVATRARGQARPLHAGDDPVRRRRCCRCRGACAHDRRAGGAGCTDVAAGQWWPDQ
jgi:hypothetical protein